MDDDLLFVSSMLNGKTKPEEVFGTLSGSADQRFTLAKKTWRSLVRKIHPDRYTNPTDKRLAEELFRKLDRLWNAAQRQIKNGTYGKSALTDPIVIRSRKHQYTITDLIDTDELASFYLCDHTDGIGTQKAVFKVARRPADNDLLVNEARILKILAATKDPDTVKLLAYVPALIESMRYEEAGTKIIRQANTMAFTDGLVSLKDTRAAFPNGVDPKHVAWIFRRLLLALHVAHDSGVVHAGVLPGNILIHPREHGLVLTNWCYSVYDPVVSGERISAINADYRDWYPPEVLAKGMPSPSLDIYMAAECMIELLGGQPLNKTFPARVSKPLTSFFRGCILERPNMRPQDALPLRKEFTRLIEQLWGKRQFIPFHVPSR